MRFDIYQWSTNQRIASFATEEAALRWLRETYDPSEPGSLDDIGLLTIGGPVLTYPLEGAHLLARAFGLEAAATDDPHIERLVGGD